MEIAREFAARIGAIEFETLPDIAVSNAKSAIMDTLGVTLAGSCEEGPRLLLKVPGIADSGPSLVFGTGVRASALNAALVNGVSAHAMDFDDVNVAVGGHPSAAILPGLFAAAEMANASGRDLITAFLAGFETMAAIGRGVNLYHYERGWHPTATIGVFGATAACARLLGLESEKTARALAIAASLASGIKANFGTMTKPLHVGHCTRNGVFAALLAREGFTSNPQSMEHKQGFLEVFNGQGNYDVARMFEGWADPLNIVRPGLGLKLYPCCGSTHAPIDAGLKVRNQHHPRPEDIERVEILVHPRRLPHTDRPSPKSDLEAKFSIQYCLTRALLEGRVVVEHFEHDAHRDAAVQAFLPRVFVIPYTHYVGAPDHYATELTVKMRSGEKYFVRLERPLGRVAEEPAPRESIRAKFESCARRALSSAAVGELYDQVERLEQVASIRELSEVIAGNAPERRIRAA